MLEKLQSGERKVGVKECTKAVKSGRAAIAFVAEDADKNLIETFVGLCKEHQVETVLVPEMSEIGKSCGIAVGSAVAVRLK